MSHQCLYMTYPRILKVCEIKNFKKCNKLLPEYVLINVNSCCVSALPGLPLSAKRLSERQQHVMRIPEHREKVQHLQQLTQIHGLEKQKAEPKAVFVV